VAVDDLLDVPERLVGGVHVQLASDLHGGLAGLQDPVAQLKWCRRALLKIHAHLPLDYGHSRSTHEMLPKRNSV
jgi:hypothetical protein